MEIFVGTLDRIRVINMNPALIRFTLELPDKNLNCLTLNPLIIDKMLMIQEKKYVVKVSGKFNSRNQLIVSQFEIENSDDTIRKLGI
ncbi:hypothetical protein [Enterococcus entomosocium]|uniref:hypothetical protein n=1 Tax=Enterococcus entomosocium TaxID=3034352 RepID=UPI002648EAC8|nr:hypothetical protein [Enterococcus entomosocium]